MEKNEAYYTYGIINIEENQNNKEILNVNYGNKVIPLYIFKRDIMDLISAIISPEEREKRGITSEKVNKAFEENGTEVLDYLLSGRAMIIISDFRNYLDYTNGATTGIQKITGLNIEGEIERENAFDYESRRPDSKDLYPDLPGSRDER